MSFISYLHSRVISQRAVFLSLQSESGSPFETIQLTEAQS